MKFAQNFGVNLATHWMSLLLHQKCQVLKHFFPVPQKAHTEASIKDSSDNDVRWNRED